ncbi:MAG: T9SS type A sorting domain-containing protein [Flavobacteriales bacterium]
MIKTIFFSLLLLPFLSIAQDWPIKGTPDWPSYQTKDLNDTCDVIPLGVNFGLCDMALGWALTDSGCVVLSGCGWIGSDGIDYQSSFFSSSYECNSACMQDTVIFLSCIDSSLLDPLICCASIYEPVCGCDSITYSNSCVATFYYGISSYYLGECVTSKVQNKRPEQISVYPNPSSGIFNLKPLPLGSIIRFYSVFGQLICSTEVVATEMQIDLDKLPKGCYFFTIDNGISQKLLIE